MRQIACFNPHSLCLARYFYCSPLSNAARPWRASSFARRTFLQNPHRFSLHCDQSPEPSLSGESGTVTQFPHGSHRQQEQHGLFGSLCLLHVPWRNIFNIQPFQLGYSCASHHLSFML